MMILKSISPRWKVPFAAFFSLFIQLGFYSPLLGAEALPLSTSYWKSSSFKKSFNGSYRIEARIEPQVSTAERGLLVEMQTLMEKGQRKSALSKIKSSSLTSKSAALKFNLGNLHFEEGNTKEALTAYRGAIAIYPSFRRAHRNLAMALIQNDELDQALSPLIEAMRLGDADGATYGLLGYCRLKRGEWESALQAYRMAQLTQPETADWKAGIAQCLQNLNARAEAIAMLDEVIRQRPDEASYASLQAAIMLELGQEEEAVKTLELPRRLNRLDPDGLLLLADLHLRATRLEDAQDSIAEAFADNAAKVKPSLDRIISVIDSAMRINQWSLASDLVQKATPPQGPSPRPLRTAAARLKIESEESPTEGAEELRTLLEEEPTDGTVLMALAGYELSLNNIGDAEILFERATAVSSTAVEAWVELAKMRVDQKRYPAALKAVDEALKIDPTRDFTAYRAALARLVEASQ